METTYFVLGMLSIISVIFVALVVWGIVKINGLSKAIKQHEVEISNLNRTIWENHHELREDLNRRIDSMNNHANNYEKDLNRQLDIRFKDMYDEIGHTRSYIDSRIDKVTGTLGAKQVIKG